jgi:hypothetical protein
MVGVGTRGLALRAVVAVIAGTLIGSVAPESGTALAYNLGIPTHIFNWLFLAIGITGISLALYLGLRKRG